MADFIKRLSLRIAFFSFAFGLSHAAQAAAPFPHAVEMEIVKLNTTPGDSCMMVRFFPAYYGPIQGVTGNVAIGTIDQDGENCGYNVPVVSVVTYVINDGDYRAIPMPAYVTNLQQPEILSVVPRENGFSLYALFRGPSDPMCCSNRKTTDWVAVH